MASQRLTNYVREAILKAALDRAFKAREEELKAEQRAFADAVYHDQYPPELLSKMKALPDGFLLTDDDFRVRFGSNNWERVCWGERRIIAKKHEGTAIIYDDDHALSLRFNELERKDEELCAEKTAAERNAKAVLNSVTTYNKLIEVWPEIEPLAAPFKQNEARATTFALSLPITQLNKALGLPPT